MERSDSNVREAATKILNHDIGFVLVREGQDATEMVTERDFLKIAKHCPPFRVLVSEVMSKPLDTVSTEASRLSLEE